MLSVADTIQRRELAGRRTSTILLQRHGYNSNNNAKSKNQKGILSAKDLQNPQSTKKTKAEKKTEAETKTKADKKTKTEKKAESEKKMMKKSSRSRSRSKDKPKSEKGTKNSPNADQKKPKKKGKLFASLPSFKPKLFTTKVQTPNVEEPIIAPVGTYVEKIADEEVIVNKVLLFNEEEEKNIYLASEDSNTPPNFMKTLFYYQQVNKARVTYIRAADYAGDLLLRGEVEGDADSWEEFLEKKKEEVRKWRKECDERHTRRGRDTRKVVEGEGTLGLKARKFGRDVKMWMWEQFVDIFPCCVPE